MLASQFSLHACGLLPALMAVPLLRNPPLSSPQVAWEKPSYDSLTIMCGLHFSPAKKDAGPHHVDEKQLLMELFQDGKEFDRK